MPLVLTKTDDDTFSGKVGSTVMLSITSAAGEQWLAGVSYNGKNSTVAGNTAPFDIVLAVEEPLMIFISGHEVVPDDLTVSEVGKDGTTQVLYSYDNDYEADINLYITGVA